MDAADLESIPEETRALVQAATISIDAARPDTYAENRRGGDFATLLERLAFISDLRTNGPLKYLEFHMTVQANNFREMAEFVELGRRHKCDRVSFHQLLDWATFSSDEYCARAVQSPDHPEHSAFLELISDPLLEDPIVYLSNFSDLKWHASEMKSLAANHAIG